MSLEWYHDLLVSTIDQNMQEVERNKCQNSIKGNHPQWMRVGKLLKDGHAHKMMIVLSLFNALF